MRSLAKRKRGPELSRDETVVLLIWLLGLLGAFGFTCWMCYRLIQMPPFVLVPPSLGGS